ncbi:hypothetical protein FQA47_009262 [Oryzias melastigma]|uniref:Uncharacterized protein n=1 Tax=Oryzias melastigma TaxID=30732 RepID=A0A834F8S2_ORYME|nr:hypothetical protein FQA47_009262 [Oryzias melastigma]
MRHYVNEQPRQSNQSNTDRNQSTNFFMYLIFISGYLREHGLNVCVFTERSSCERFFLGFGLICITQALLNISLRMTLNCSKNPFYCNTTDVAVHTLDEAIEIGIMNRYQKLQEKVKALTRDNKILERRNHELMGKCGWQRLPRNHTLPG